MAAGLACLVAAPLVWSATQPTPAGQTVTTVNAAAAGALALSDPMSLGSSGRTPESAAVQADSTAVPVAEASVPGPVESAAPQAEVATTEVAPAEVAPAEVAPAEVAPAEVAPAEVPEPAAGAPVRIQLPALNVDTVVTPVGVDDDGALQVPDDVDEIGWYRFGPVPGAATGSAVLTGHVDDRRQGEGAFAKLGSLAPGDQITLIDELGAVHAFEVLSREEWPKSEVPVDRLFDRGGSGRLVLITCGGSFDRAAGRYQDNIAITAVPVGS